MHIHPLHFHYALNRELTELYASIAIRNFTLGLISIFEPIYIFLYFSQNLSATLLYFGAISLLFGLLAPFAGKIITKIGVKHSMLLSIPFLFLYYVGLWQIESLGTFFFVLVVLRALYNVLYWTGFHIDFSRFSEKRNRGKQLSYRHIVAAISATASPVIGGILLLKFGWPVLFVIVLVLLFVSIAPLFLSKEIHERYKDSFGDAFREVFQKKYRGKVLAFFAEGGEPIAQIIIWPIFLYVLAISYSSIGLISSVSLFGGLLFALYLGRLIDVMGRAKLLSIGSWLNALAWPLKMFVQTPFDALLANTLHKFTRLTAYMPLGALFYDWTSRSDVNRDRFIILREMVLNVGRGLLLFLFAGIFLFTNNIAIVFPIAGAFSLMLVFFTKGEKIQGARKSAVMGIEEVEGGAHE